MQHGRLSIVLFVVPMMSVWLCLSGCMPGRFGETVELPAVNPEENARKNLEAIRAMQVDLQPAPAKTPAPSSLSSGPSSKIEPEPSLTPSDVQADVIPLVPSSAPASSNAAAKTKIPPIIPWTPSPLARPSLPDRPVPAYTIPAPVGPDYSGSIRCVPDGLGGQRCLPR